VIDQHVAFFLEANEYATLGTNLFNGVMPAEPDHCWSVLSAPGLPSKLASAYNHDTEYVEVYIRSFTPETARRNLTEARDHLLSLAACRLHATTEDYGESPPVFLIQDHVPLHEEYRDAKNRVTYSFTLAIQYGNLVSRRPER
jgi:hypothetical protein